MEYQHAIIMKSPAELKDSSARPNLIPPKPCIIHEPEETMAMDDLPNLPTCSFPACLSFSTNELRTKEIILRKPVSYIA